jgi:hypothetical protein
VRFSRAPALVLALFAVAACQRTNQAGKADCSRVAETLASFEIGNHAPPDQRAPVVAKHKAACQTTNVTADEATCLGKATDTWTARACLPRMFPAKPAEGGSTAGCSTVAVRMRAAVMGDVGSNGSAAAAQLDKLVPVVQASCEQDSWPKNVVQCVVDGKQGDMNAFQTCMNQLPQDYQLKLSERLQASMQPPGAQQPPTTPPAQ